MIVKINLIKCFALKIELENTIKSLKYKMNTSKHVTCYIQNQNFFKSTIFIDWSSKVVNKIQNHICSNSFISVSFLLPNF